MVKWLGFQEKSGKGEGIFLVLKHIRCGLELFKSGKNLKSGSSLLSETLTFSNILGDPGADSGGEGKSKRGEKYGTKKSKERREEPLRTMSYQTSSKRSPPF